MANVDFGKASVHKVTGPKHLSLGRSTYYDQFVRIRAEATGHPVYQSDYMVWIRPADPYASLLYYIQTAEHIDFNLEGISLEELQLAAEHGKPAADRRELGTQYMTTWEINQVLCGPRHSITVWHVPAGAEPALYAAALRLAGVEPKIA